MNTKILRKNNASEVEVILRDYPDNLSHLISELLDIKNFRLKIDARNKLISMGKEILPYLHKLLQTNNNDLRKEVAKVVGLISDHESIPSLILLLDDTEFEIRWIAAEALVGLGRKSIRPLLKSIREGKSSLFLNRGAHHVLRDLLIANEKRNLRTLLRSLGNYLLSSEIAPAEAAKALEKYQFAEWV